MSAAEDRSPAFTGLQTRLRELGYVLIGYGPSDIEQARHAADYVDRILKGARPSDLPIEQPTKFELVINLRTAKTLGLAFPHPS